jgi:hypothetical protein
VFFEIKRRSNDAIVKKRGGVKREAVNWLLAGHLPEPEHLLWDATAQLYAVEKFSYLMLDIKATPKVHVAYMREAWVSTKDNSIRVTMDRQVRTAPEFTNCLSTEVCDPVKPFGDRIVLELKFTGRFPNWFREMVQAFDLNRSSAAKYADGVAIMGEDRLYRNRVNGHRFPGAHIEAGASRLGRGSREAGAFV